MLVFMEARNTEFPGVANGYEPLVGMRSRTQVF